MSSLKIVRASAGSGKTYRLAAEYIAAAMEHPAAFRGILAVTFTNKATTEMKGRILDSLYSLSNGENQDFAQLISSISGYPLHEIKDRALTTLAAILSDYSSFAISTIDKFFQRIVRSFFKELGLDISYEVIIDQKKLIAEAIDTLVEKSANDKDIARKLSKLTSKSIEEGKKINLQKELTSLFTKAIDKNFVVADDFNMASTEELFANICKINDENVQALKDKCEQACELIDRNNLQFTDFKYGKTSFASYFYKVRNTDQISAPSNRFREAATKKEESLYKPTKNAKSELIAILPEIMSLTSEVMAMYDRSLPLRSTVEAIERNFVQYSLLKELSAELARLSSLSGQLSLSSTTTLLSRITEGASVPFIFERLGSRYNTIFIDEFQDTSLGQWDGFLPLVVEAISQKEEGLAVMIIGDVKQAIYRWRGGDQRLLDSGVESNEEIGEVDNIFLDTSWRSDPEVVNFNNNLFGKIASRGTDVVDTFLDDDDSNPLRDFVKRGYKNHAQKLPPHKEGTKGGYVEIRADQEENILAWLAENVLDAKQRYTPSRIAILVRSGAQGMKIAEKLTDVGIEFVSDELLKIGKSRVVNFIIRALEYSVLGGAICLRAMEQYLSRPLTEADTQFIESLKYLDILRAVEMISVHFSLENKELYYLQTLYNLCYGFLMSDGGAIADFLVAWDEGLCDKSVVLPENDSAVKILTIHKSKGLEYDVVFVPFADWKLLPSGFENIIWGKTNVEPFSQFGLFPLKYNKELANSVYAPEYFEEGVMSIADNINVLYVALTRACHELYIGHSDKVSTDAKTVGDLINLVHEGNTIFGEKSTKKKSAKSTLENLSFTIESIRSYNEPQLKILEEE